MDAQQIDHRIRTLLERILEMRLESVAPNAHLMNDLGADSWQYLEFRNEIETAFGITIPDSDVDRLSTMEDCARLVSELLEGENAEG